MSTNGLNNEEAHEENMGVGRGCLFLRCSSKQTTSRCLVDIIPVLFRRYLFVLHKIDCGRILMRTNALNNEETLEENAGFAGICLLFD
jgi:hypothetical protein